jgi:hypothetical protein
MHDHALVAVILLALSGLLRPLQWRARGFVSLARPTPASPPRPSASPDQAPMSLNAIELALIAEHSLEMARANQAVADDAATRLETRREAAQVAAAWRERAEQFHIAARRRSADPIVPSLQSIRPYSGPERRRRMRRAQTRRNDPTTAGDGRGDRRAGPERRGHDRRGPEPAPR